MDTDRLHSLPDPATTTILPIDHDDKDRTYYADRLKISIPNCIVLEAKDIRSGLEIYRSRRVDCIVTEIHPPDGSGFELAQAIRKTIAVGGPMQKDRQWVASEQFDVEFLTLTPGRGHPIRALTHHHRKGVR